MKSTERKTGPGAWEALRQQRERAAGLPVSEGLEERIMETVRSGGTAVVLWQRVAAVAAALLVVGGLSLAAVVIGRSRTADAEGEGRDAIAAYRTGEAETKEEAVVLFEGARLDSMLTVVAGHYGRRVAFADEAMKSLKVHTRWNPGEALAVFVENLNELDVVRITDERDTLFVKKGGKE